MRFMNKWALVSAAALTWAAGAWAAPSPATLTVDAGAAGTPVSPTLYGIFFEDINYSADGGLYAEMVQNRSFEFKRASESWKLLKEGQQAKLATPKADGLNPSNTHFARLTVPQAGPGIANSGYGGLVLTPGHKYQFSVYLRSPDATVTTLKANLETDQGAILGSLTVGGITNTWKMFTGTLDVKSRTTTGQLALRPDQAGTVDIDMASLFPEKTFKDRPNGLRVDLADLLSDLHPRFLRFPGGCNVQGKTMASSYKWKETLGDVAQRKANDNFWGYYQTNGLGFYEYFQFCEDVGAEPLPVLNAGMAFQDSNDFVPVSGLGPYIQDCLDLIEYANGDANTKWGAVRVQSGHPAPFNMKILAIGNEQWGIEYFQRYKIIAEAVKARYPQVQLVYSTGPLDSGPIFDEAWAQVCKMPVDIVDEHYYMSPEWFLSNTKRYDSYDRKGPKIFLGEYAANGDGHRNNLYAALAEAAYMTGLERNGDVVKMASYAPLLAFEGYTQWVPDMIWFNSEASFGTPSYYVQKIFSQNLTAASLPATLKVENAKPADNSVAGGIGLGTWATQADYKEIKVEGKGTTLFQFKGDSLDEWNPGNGEWDAKAGTITQKSDATECTASVPGNGWKGYTLSLKARKTAGAEGFLILFGVQGNQYYWWNLGGWNNTQSAIEKGTGSSRGLVGKGVPISIDTNRWYDIRIELKDGSIRCYLNNKLVHDLKVPELPGTLYAHAGRSADGSLVIKAVNLDDGAQPLHILLNNAPSYKETAQVTLLSNPDRDAENSFKEPKKVVPQEVSFQGVSGDFTYSLSPHSVTILKLVPKK